MKKIAALLLALPLLLAGCAAGGAGGTLCCRAAGAEPSEVLITVDGRELTADRCLYWLAAACDALTRQAAGAGPDWDADRDGASWGDYARQYAADTAALYATIENWARRYGCTLTDGDEAALDEARSGDVRRAGGEKAYAAALAAQGLTPALARQLSADYRLYLALRALAETEGSPLCPAPGETERWAASAGLVTADAITLTGDGAEKRAAALRSRLTAGKDPAAAFAAEQAAAPAQERFQAAITVLPGDDALPEAAISAAAALKEGQWSPPVAADGGIMLLLRLPADSRAAAERRFDDQLQAAAKDAGVVIAERYRQLDVGAFYEKLTKIRAANPS